MATMEVPSKKYVDLNSFQLNVPKNVTKMTKKVVACEQTRLIGIDLDALGT